MSTASERNEQRLRAALDGSRFATVNWVHETGSTNRDLVASSLTNPVEQVLITDLQTAGRGRRDRAWTAPAGASLLMSVLVSEPMPALPFWTVGALALAAVEAIEAAGGIRVGIKWPNDLTVGEAKVAGILAQVIDGGVVVGMGLNVGWPQPLPPELIGRATSLNHHTDTRLERAELAASTIANLEATLAAPGDELRLRWKQHCTTIGRRVRVELDHGEAVGEAVDVAPDGGLVVVDVDGVEKIHHVGDVVHLRPL